MIANNIGIEDMSNKSKSVLEMTGKEAREFFLKESSYSSLFLPEYISFKDVINQSIDVLTSRTGNNKDVHDIIKEGVKLGDINDLNYIIYINKDYPYTWRPISLLHPVLYVDLVNYITNDEGNNGFGWLQLQERFAEFRDNERIRCFSIPCESLQKNKTDDGLMIFNWWKNMEQESIYNSLNYSYCLYTDIADFYPSIYTHSICWAIHGKEDTKLNVKKSLGWYGGKIDSKIQHMQNNQTNGIPQGSVLMDFISEIILGYIDLKLTERLNEIKIEHYYILRYRDDYRIFSNEKSELEEILKIFQEVLQDLNLKLNSDKTFFSEKIIFDSIKPDKLYWEPKRLALRNSYLNKNNMDKGVITLQKHLWQIKELADKYPNCGMLKKSLTELYKERISKLKGKNEDLKVITSILVDIMIENPIVMPHCIIIIAKLYEKENNYSRQDIVNSIINKYSKKSNTEYVEIWLQRLMILHPNDENSYNKINSKIVSHISNSTEINKIFPLDWIEETTREKIKNTKLFDEKKYYNMNKNVSESEIDIFNIFDY